MPDPNHDKTGTDTTPDHGVPPSQGERATAYPSSDREHTERVLEQTSVQGGGNDTIDPGATGPAS